MDHELGAIDQAQCVIFDFDGTLFHLDCNWEQARIELSEAFPTIKFQSIRMGLNQVDTELGPEALRKAYGILQRVEGEGTARPIEQNLDMLRACIDQGKQVGVFTANCYETVRFWLHEYHLDNQVSVIISGDASPRRKPDPSGLLIAMDELGAHRSETLYVADGDREEQTAAQIGVKCLRVA